MTKCHYLLVTFHEMWHITHHTHRTATQNII